jgi:hypothetical protein
MADREDRIHLDSAIQLIFSDASKTISDLKTRQWSATTLSVAGILGVDTIRHRSTTGTDPGMSQWSLTGFMLLILVGHILVMWRCNRNLGVFRSRLKTTVQDKFPLKVHALFDKDFEGAVVDEGTIVAIMYGLVAVAFVFALADIWNFWNIVVPYVSSGS